jgi:ABC-2 type transport system permease protein
MFKTIVEHELKNILLSPKFPAIFIVCAFLLIISVYVGIQQFNASVRQYETINQLTSQEMRENTNWMSLSTKAHRKPEPLQIFVSGINYDIGRFSSINQFESVKLVHSTYSDDPVYAIFRFLDFTFIITVVLSLFTILFTYDSVNGEKEKGTLRLIFSNPVPRVQFILAKFSGIWLGLIIPIIIPIMISLLIMLLFNVALTGADWIKLISLIAVSILYLTFFIAAGVFISTITKRSSISFLVSLLIWICFVFIIPRAGVILAGQVVSVPTIAEIEGKQDRYSKDRWDKSMKESQQRWTERNKGMDKLSEAEREAYREEKMWEWMEEEDKERKMVEADIEKNNKLLLEEVRNKKAIQEKLAFMFSRLSPVSSFQLVAQNIAGTGLNLKNRYEDAISQYRTEFNSYKEKKKEESGDIGGIRIMIDSEKGVKIDTDREKGTLDISSIPKFAAAPYQLQEGLSLAVVDVGLLSAFTILFFAAAFFFFLKYDLR